ncbi:MAG: hypothetical protein ABI972_23930 [Acidobacteriota bacterium]
MPSKFRLELDIVIDGNAAVSVIEAARQCHMAEGTITTVDKSGCESTRRAEAFIDGIEDALMELVERNPLLANERVEIQRVACKPAAAWPEARRLADPNPEGPELSAPADDSMEKDETEDDLEDFETGLYLCRWPNGEFSLVQADNRKDAVVQLDEWAGAEPAWLVPVETCMVDFRLNDRGEIELSEFGEETAEFIWGNCYPELDEALSSVGSLQRSCGKRNREAANKIQRAVEHERKRLWNTQKAGAPAQTALGRELQKRLGTVGPVADHYVEVAANKILRTSRCERGKPN